MHNRLFKLNKILLDEFFFMEYYHHSVPSLFLIYIVHKHEDNHQITPQQNETIAFIVDKL